MNSSDVPLWRSVIVAIGVTTPTCPYCGHTFEKMPQRKRACPQCSGVFYARKRAFDSAKALLTEAASREGEAQDALVTLSQTRASTAVLNELVETLRGQVGRLPTADEVVLQYLVRDSAAQAAAKMWGLYRNARFELAESYVRLARNEDGLRLFLEVLLFDVNGAANSEDVPFDPKLFLAAPGAFGQTLDVINLLELSQADVRSAFESVATPIAFALKMPLPVAHAWSRVSKELW